MSLDKSLLGRFSHIKAQSRFSLTTGALALASLAAVGCGPVAEEDAATTQQEIGFVREVRATFRNCIEFGGVGVVPAANVQHLVPAQYTLSPGPPGLAIAVAHMAKCQEIKVGDGVGRPGLMGHLGVLINAPTGTGNFNNYLFAHVTDDPLLFASLKLAGLQTTYISPNLRFDVLGSGSSTTLSAASQRPRELGFTLSGPFALPDASQPPGTNLINYWTDSRRAGNAVLEYNISGLRVQPTPDVVLSAVGSDLQDIVGGTQLSFPFFAAGESFESTTLTFRPRAF
jgi:hypothetical protein